MTDQRQKIRYARYHGPMDGAECQRILRSDLYKIGDAVLVWVNEGDIVTHGELLNEDVIKKEPPGGG